MGQIPGSSFFLQRKGSKDHSRMTRPCLAFSPSTTPPRERYSGKSKEGDCIGCHVNVTPASAWVLNWRSRWWLGETGITGRSEPLAQRVCVQGARMTQEGLTALNYPSRLFVLQTGLHGDKSWLTSNSMSERLSPTLNLSAGYSIKSIKRNLALPPLPRVFSASR